MKSDSKMKTYIPVCMYISEKIIHGLVGLYKGPFSELMVLVSVVLVYVHFCCSFMSIKVIFLKQKVILFSL